MTPEEMTAFLESRLNYERRGMPAQQELRIDRVAALLELIGSPQRAYPVIHVAGSKGKGSTSHMIAALLTSTGATVGLHTSPHFERLEERFRVSGEDAPPEQVAQLLAQLIPAIAEVDAKLKPLQPELTFFEITTALVLWYFERRAVDWAVVEVGMGGRLDSTNVVDPAVSVITNISRDHVRQLGNTLEKIAVEKAGIIKPLRPVVIGRMTPSVLAVIEEIAARNRSPVYRLGNEIDYRYESHGPLGGRVWISSVLGEWPPIDLEMNGEHQAHNAAVATAVIDVLADRLPGLDRANGVKTLERLKIPGRIEVISRQPTVILDVAHNDASAEALRQTLHTMFPPAASELKTRILIYGTSAEKDWSEILTLLAPEFDHIVVTSYLTNPRALPASEIADKLPLPMRSAVTITKDPAEAWQTAQNLLRSAGDCFGSLICITGSFYLAAEFRELLRRIPTDPSIRA